MERPALERAAVKAEVLRRVSRILTPWVLKVADLPERAEVLEVGCGPGFTAESCMEHHENWSYTATDVDPDMVTAATQRLARFGDRARIEPADATALPYPDHGFDVVISITVARHVEDWELALAESARVLRPSGTMIMADLLDGAYSGPIRRAFPPARTYTLGELREALAKAGFARWRFLPVGRLGYRLVAQVSSGEPELESGG